MDKEASALRRRLRQAGLSDPAINAAWPAWWSDAATVSRSARVELRFALARNLGLSPKSLLGDRVEFVWKDEARFKHLLVKGGEQQSILTSFCITVGRLVLRASPERGPVVGISAEGLRGAVLRSRPFVDLVGLLASCWGLGIPVVHLRVFPLPAKSMHATVVTSGGRYAVLLGRDSNYPAPVAFTLAHELGHVVLGHLDGSLALVDVDDPAIAVDEDAEESAADKFALTLLTGMPQPDIRTNIDRFGPRQLAAAAMEAGPDQGIEPGTLALCLAYRTNRWAAALGALRHIYAGRRPVWREVNGIAAGQLEWGALGDAGADYLRNLLGLSIV